MQFNKYYYENYPMDTPFDINNPRYVLSLDGVDDVLEKIITNEPYTLTVTDFENIEIVKALLHIDVLQQKADKFGMAVPFFVENDEKILKKISKRVASDISSKMLEYKEQIIGIVQGVNNGYAPSINLYHLLCGYIFDGLMFEYLEKEQLITTSCIHKTGLDYLVIIYEDAISLNQYSEQLLCSYNRLVRDGKGFVSFGDSNGNRKDLYRYLRMKELGELSDKESLYVDYSVIELIDNFEKLLDKKKVEAKYLKVYEYFGYLKDGKVNVPVYNDYSYEVANRLYDYVVEIVREPLAEALSLIRGDVRLSAIAHGVAVKDIANEIYHLIFGEINELLIQSGLVAQPKCVQGEGRYLKSFER